MGLRLRVPRRVVRLALLALVALLWAALNRTASLFEIRPGLAFFFPAAALTVVAAVSLRWLGVLAVFAGGLIFPWGAAQGPWHALLFAIPSTLWAALVVLLPAPSGMTLHRLRRFVVFAVMGGSALSALLGGALLTLLAGGWSWNGYAQVVTFWWVPDFAAVLSFGLPVLLFLTVDQLMDREDQQLWRRWVRDRHEVLRVVILALASAGGVLALAGLSGVTVHSFVVLLLPAVVVASLRGGVGAGLLANGIVSSLYLGLGLAAAMPAKAELPVVLTPIYANLFLFVAFALLAGVLGGRNRQLVEHVWRQSEVLTRGLEETVEALAAATQARDRESDGHATRVARLSVLLGKQLGVAGDELAVLRRAALLHDVGKIGVPEAILNKAAELEAAERAVLGQQVEMGEAILQRVEFLHPVLTVLRYYQERWDGRRDGPRGGHYGLVGAEIPLASRIIAAVEAFDAMTHDRPYRHALSRQAAVAELWRCSGTQFDPAVVAAMTRVLAQEWDISGDDWPAVSRA